MIGKGVRLVGVGAVCLLAASLMGVTVPFLVNYQGRVNNSGGQPVSGPVSMNFAIYDAPTGGNVLWGETQTVTLNTGLYNVLLGSMNPLSPQVFNSSNVFLEVSVNGETMSPRQQIASVPFAMRAGLASIDPTDPATMLAVEQAYNNAEANPDLDGDGWSREPWGNDCDDANPTVYPGAPELCDGIDNQCPGDPGYAEVDEGCTAAGSILVNTAADTLEYAGGGISGLGPTVSLRDAILAANDQPGHQVIQFHSSLAGTGITVSSQLPEILQGVTIDGDINGDGSYNQADDATLDLSTFSGSSVALASSTSGVAIKHIGFNGYNLAVQATAALLITAPPGASVSNIVVQDSVFSGTAGTAILVSGVLNGSTPGTVSGVTLQGLNMSGSGQCAIMITGGPSSGNNLSNINVYNSQITSGTFSSGVFVDGGFNGGGNNHLTNVKINETSVQGLPGAGIQIFGGSSTGVNNKVSVSMRADNLDSNQRGLDVHLGVDTSSGNSLDVSAVSTSLENNSGYGVYAARESDSIGTINVDLGGNGLSSGLNTLSGNGAYGFYNASTDDMYAENNYWGSSSGPADGDTFDIDGIPDPTGSGDLISGFIYYGPYTQGQWTADTAPDLGMATVAGMVQDIAAPASNEVYAGAGRFVLDYQGSSWNADQPAVPPGLQFQSISSPASGLAWAVATADNYDQGTAVFRLSGGTWTREALPSIPGTVAWLGVHMTSSSQGWLVGSYSNSGPNRGIVLAFDGTSWSEQAVPALGGDWWELDDVHALDPSHALAVGQMNSSGTSWGVILYWDGSVWSSQSTPPISSDWRLSRVVSIQDGTTVKSWALGRDNQNNTGLMLYSENYSGSWSIVSLPPRVNGYELDGIDVSSPTLGYAAGVEFAGNTVDGVLLHYDGSNWTDDPVSISSSFWGLFSVDVVSPTEAYAGGIDIANHQSVVLAWNGSTWTEQAMPSADQWYDLTAVDFPSSGTGWAVGQNYDAQQGQILQYSAGSWSAVPSPIPDMMWTLSDVSFPTTAKGWAVGSSKMMNRGGLVLAYNSGTWSRDNTLPDPGSEWTLDAVSFPSDTQGWAAGVINGNSTNGAVLEYNSGTWSVDPLPYLGANWSLADLHFDSTSDGWAVGYNYSNDKGTILRYTGGAWTDATPGSTVTSNLNLTSVYFLDSNTGWVGAQDWSGNGRVLSYNSGIWTATGLTAGGPGPCKPKDVTAIAANRVWLAGWRKMPNNNEFKYPRAWYYNGSTWGVYQNFGLIGSNVLSGIKMLTESEGWAVGQQFDSSIPNTRGLIEHYQ